MMWLRQGTRQQVQMGLIFAAIAFAILAPIVGVVFLVLRWFD